VSKQRERRANLLAVIGFGTAFGFVEAAVVYYLRLLIKFHSIYQLSHYKVYLNLGFITFVSPRRPLLMNARLGDVEVTREAATILMLVFLSFVASTVWKRRLGAFMTSFACWDIAYYVFLRILDHWPSSLMTRDVYFLIPVTWIGPVITPLVICSVMLVVGSWLYLE
jgi:hypothetical protein